jgi:hypothetical protein
MRVSGYTVRVVCPVCQVGDVGCMIGFEDGGRSFDDHEAEECQCYESVLVDKNKYREALERAALNATPEDYS